METEKQVIAILSKVKPTKALAGISDIIEGGYLDSFELMNLISMLVDNFGIEIGIDEISPENFNSVDAITAMVDRLLQVK